MQNPFQVSISNRRRQETHKSWKGFASASMPPSWWVPVQRGFMPAYRSYWYGSDHLLISTHLVLQDREFKVLLCPKCLALRGLSLCLRHSVLDQLVAIWIGAGQSRLKQLNKHNCSSITLDELMENNAFERESITEMQTNNYAASWVTYHWQCASHSSDIEYLRFPCSWSHLLFWLHLSLMPFHRRIDIQYWKKLWLMAHKTILPFIITS